MTEEKRRANEEHLSVVYALDCMKNAIWHDSAAEIVAEGYDYIAEEMNKQVSPEHREHVEGRIIFKWCPYKKKIDWTVETEHKLRPDIGIR